MDFINMFEQIRAAGIDAEWSTLNNGLPQIQVRILGVTFFIVPDHFPGYKEVDSDFLCLRTFMPMGTIGTEHKDFLDAAFNRIASNIKMVKIYTVINEDTLYVFFEIQMLTSPERFIACLPRYAAECIRAIQAVCAFVNAHPPLSS